MNSKIQAKDLINIGLFTVLYFVLGCCVAIPIGFGEEYADRVMSVMPTWSIVLVVAGIFGCAILGGLLGRKLLKKHFAKAGIA